MCVVPGDSCDGDGGVIDAPLDDAPDDVMTIDAPMCADPDANTWLPQASLAAGTSADYIVVLDGNNDNKLDIAVLDESDSISFYAGNGDGTFGPRQMSTSGADSKKLITGDFDRDGQRDDIVVLQSGATTNAMAIMASNGNGTFTRTGRDIGSNAVDIGNAGDVDGNGREDVIILLTPSGMPRLEVILQINTGTFWEQGTPTATNQAATSMFVGRVNTGGITDAVVTMTGTNQMGLHVGSGTTAAYVLGSLNVANVPSPVEAVAGQLRSTGTPTIVTVSSSASMVALRHINGVSGTTDGGTIAVGTNPKAVILANMIGNSLPEILTADSGSNQVSILLNQDTMFANPTTLQVGSNPSDLVAGDFDGDGRLDLAVANKGSQNISVFLNRCEP
jgi:hypothetical protein